MVRATKLLFVICFVLCLCQKQARAEAFGRFGYTEKVDVPGFLLDRKGFRVKNDLADNFKFDGEVQGWKPLSTSSLRQMISLGGTKRAPQKLQIDLLAQGFRAYFENGFGFKITSTASPYLSWAEGSVAENVPTPVSKWIVVSFRDNQPPVLLCFPTVGCDLIIRGNPGDWRIESRGLFRGWV